MVLRHLWWLAILASSSCAEPPDRAPERLQADYSEPIVLLLSPDSAEVSRLQQELGDDFFVVADDAMWYRAEAVAWLDSLQIPHVEVGRGTARFLVDGRSRRVSWEDAAQTWFSVVYDGKAEPKISSDVDLREAMANFPGTPP
jgi:hypothetical protein